MNNCIFCRIISGEFSTEIIAQNDQCVVIKDIAPKAPIHFLIIPKKHVADITALDTLDVGSDIFALAQHISRTHENAREFKLVINNGHSAGQRVFHLHAHYLAGGHIESV